MSGVYLELVGRGVDVRLSQRIFKSDFFRRLGYPKKEKTFIRIPKKKQKKHEKLRKRCHVASDTNQSALGNYRIKGKSGIYFPLKGK